MLFLLFRIFIDTISVLRQEYTMYYSKIHFGILDKNDKETSIFTKTSVAQLIPNNLRFFQSSWRSTVIDW